MFSSRQNAILESQLVVKISVYVLVQAPAPESFEGCLNIHQGRKWCCEEGYCMKGEGMELMNHDLACTCRTSLAWPKAGPTVAWDRVQQ